MKKLITIALLCIAALTTNPVTSTEAADQTLVKAYRASFGNMHAYFDDIDCMNHFISMYPQYVSNGKVWVSPDVVFTNCDW
jgi:hypothetical protein